MKISVSASPSIFLIRGYIFDNIIFLFFRNKVCSSFMPKTEALCGREGEKASGLKEKWVLITWHPELICRRETRNCDSGQFCTEFPHKLEGRTFGSEICPLLLTHFFFVFSPFSLLITGFFYPLRLSK